jgi:hypothetical protein
MVSVQETFSQDEKGAVSSVSLSLNQCSIDLDPGLVDRTYILINYAEMDPDCLKVPVRKFSSFRNFLSIFADNYCHTEKG